MVLPIPTSGGSQQQNGAGSGKKSNNNNKNGPTAAKRKAVIDESVQQRRSGCPVLLESGCRVGVPVDSKNPIDAVKMICQNPKCEYSPFIHRRCYDEWEDLLVTVMATTSWSRSWTDAQRRSNLWDKKGYQLIGKMCRCLCGKGHVRRDLDYKPPVSEEMTKKKLKKTKANKALATAALSSKNVDCKTCSSTSKQSTAAPPNVGVSAATTTTTTTACSTTSMSLTTKDASTSSSITTTTSATNLFHKRGASQESIVLDHGCSNGEYHQRSSPQPPSGKAIDQQCSSGSSLPPSRAPFSDDAAIVVADSANEFECNVIPAVRSLLRWKNAPVNFADPALWEILGACSSETRQKISDDGGLGAALAETGYFIVGSDTVRLKENGNAFMTEHQQQHHSRCDRQTPITSLPPRMRQRMLFGSSTPPAPSESTRSSSVQARSSQHDSASQSLDRGSTNDHYDGTRFYWASSKTDIASSPPAAPLACSSTPDPTASIPGRARSLSSGFDEESLGSSKSVEDVHQPQQTNNRNDDPPTEQPQIGTTSASSCFLAQQQREPNPQSRRGPFNFGTMWAIDCSAAAAAAAYMNRYQHHHHHQSTAGASSPAHFVQSSPSMHHHHPFPAAAGYVGPLVMQQQQQQSLPPQHTRWIREYLLFNGPSLEELFCRAVPSLYNGPGRRFESNSAYCA